ncbi:type II toxin-antitoxin system PemK/MazF family toxin [Haliscomenobacter hydrossis]|uniref:PemK family protein n=1 Tax=Haliscomenobacter hydrossis (strain ATCC 27775 / DSM 1100 / LMG 10767 / O) TaxID=760192 RepID=F4L5Q2_HALH1|nr:type II toxin-antitoxin system PemK/MazF family toxin [Haliscomenobacter hydrossis]AEE51887.1 PemK family protein [Haliscomenobacter hydrossis DSM 1100]
MSRYSRADILMVDFGSTPNEARGHEQAFVRPALVVQVFENSKLLVVVPFSSRSYAVQAFPVVMIPANTGGLTQDSWALCHQVRSVSEMRVKRQLGTLPALEFEMVVEVLSDFLEL